MLNIVNAVHPLEAIEPPSIVNTVIESRPMYYPDSQGLLIEDTNRRGLFVKGEQAPPINIVKESYSFKSAQYGDLYNAMVESFQAVANPVWWGLNIIKKSLLHL